MNESYNKTLYKICKGILFGIEIETCYHNINKSSNQLPTKLNEKYDQSLIDNKNFLFKCFSNKSKKYKDQKLNWIYCHPHKKCEEYKNWVVTSDPTVYCKNTIMIEEEKYSIKQNSMSLIIPEIEFYPVEIVSPILNMTTEETNSGQGFLNLYMIYFGWLMDKNIVYTVNDTQGLHINLSHQTIPMSKYTNKFLKLIYIIEPILINMIPEERRYMIDDEERLRYKSFESIDINSLKGKHPIIKIHKNRFEVRVFDGTMIYQEIYYTTMFSILLIGASITLSEDQLNSLLEETDIKILFEKLESFILDTETINFVIDKYNKNKTGNNPQIQKSQKQQTVFPFLKISDEINQFIQTAVETSC